MTPPRANRIDGPEGGDELTPGRARHRDRRQEAPQAAARVAAAGLLEHDDRAERARAVDQQRGPAARSSATGLAAALQRQPAERSAGRVHETVRTERRRGAEADRAAARMPNGSRSRKTDGSIGAVGTFERANSTQRLRLAAAVDVEVERRAGVGVDRHARRPAGGRRLRPAPSGRCRTGRPRGHARHRRGDAQRRAHAVEQWAGPCEARAGDLPSARRRQDRAKAVPSAAS